MRSGAFRTQLLYWTRLASDDLSHPKLGGLLVTRMRYSLKHFFHRFVNAFRQLLPCYCKHRQDCLSRHMAMGVFSGFAAKPDSDWDRSSAFLDGLPTR